MLLYLIPVFFLIVLFTTNKMIKKYKIRWGETLSLSQAYMLSLFLGIVLCVGLYHTVKFFYHFILLLW